MQKMQEHFSALRRLKRLLLVPYYTPSLALCKIDIHAIHGARKGFAYMNVFAASFAGHPGAEF